MKPWYKSWTVWVAILQGFAGVLAAIVATDPNMKAAGGLATLKAAIDLVLRIKTTEGIQ